MNRSFAVKSVVQFEHVKYFHARHPKPIRKIPMQAQPEYLTEKLQQSMWYGILTS